MSLPEAKACTVVSSVVLALSIAAVPLLAHAQPVPLGGEIVLQGRGVQPAVASDGGGRFVIVWNGDDGLRGQLFDASAAAVGTEFVIDAARSSERPSVAMDANGHFIVTWMESPPEIVARSYDADAQAGGPKFRVDSTIFDYDHGYEHAYADRKGPPDAAAGSDGNFVVVWSGGYDEYLYFVHRHRDIRGRVIDADGTLPGDEFVVGGSFYYYTFAPSIAASSQGEFVVAWNEITSYTYDDSGPLLERQPNYGVRAHRLDAGGQSAGDTVPVADGLGASVAADAAGRFVVAWFTGGDVRARRYDDEAQPLGDAFPVTTSRGANANPQVAAADNGSFAIAWHAGGYTSDPAGTDLFARSYAKDGSPLGDEVAVNLYTTGWQSQPTIAFTDANNFVVAWASMGQGGAGSAIVARRFARAPACGDASADGDTSSTDAVVALLTAVGARSCPTCVCDSDNSGRVTAVDSLRILQVAVGQRVTLACEPCG